MKSLLFIFSLMAVSGTSFSAEQDPIANARLAFAKIFPSQSDIRVMAEKEIGYGIRSIQVMALNGDVVRRGHYLYKGGESAFFGNYFDEQAEGRMKGTYRNVELENEAQRFSRFITQLAESNTDTAHTRVFVIKLFLRTFGFGEIVEEPSSLGASRALLDPQVGAEIKPPIFQKDPQGVFSARLYTFTPVRELTSWVFIQNDRGNILKVERRVMQEWPIGN